MASAISSLPVPVSPLINTVASVGATTRTKPSTHRRATLLPTMRGNPLPQSSLLSIANIADVAPLISKDAVWLTVGASPAQLIIAAMLNSFPSSAIPSTPTQRAPAQELTSASFSRDPLADIRWAILEPDAVGPTALEKPDSVTIY